MSVYGSTAILIHGCHLQAIGWEEVVFKDENRLGRVPTAIIEAIQRKAKLVYWGTGASEKDGIKESQYTFNQAIEKHLDFLSKVSNVSKEELKEYLLRVSKIDKKTQNTFQEIQRAFKKCQKYKINEIILVSSPTHISRCLLYANQILSKSKDFQIKCLAIASQIGFFSLSNSKEKKELSADSVTIFEPPHRVDSANVSFNFLLKDIFLFLKDEKKAEELYEAMHLLIEEHKKCL